MRLQDMIPVAAICLCAAACTGNGGEKNTAGIRMENLDTLALPGTDFYAFATSGWQKAHPIPDDYSKYGTFSVLDEENTKRIQDLILNVSKQQNDSGSLAQKIGDLYNMVMDSVKLNKDDYLPVLPDLNKVDSIQNLNDVYKALVAFRMMGMAPYFGLYVGADEKDSNVNAVQIGQSGLTLGEKDYYVENDTATVKIRNAFKDHVLRMFRLYGFDEGTATKGRDVVMRIETRLANAFRSRTELRDVQRNYNKMTMAQLKETFPGFPWDMYLQEAGLDSVQSVIIGQPQSLKTAIDLISTTSLPDQRLYLKWQLINASAGALSDTIGEASFDFFGRTLSGKVAREPRWKRAVGAVEGSLGEAVGQMYVEKYFPAAAKERMTQLVANLKDALGNRIKNLEWMSDSTKTRALEKLATFHVKIGYPDKWKDYSTMEIKNDSYWENQKRVARWYYDDMIQRYGKPVDRDEWFMTPQTVNAYYNPTTNEICFPAGILQDPFFNMDADDAFNYGAIGVVIGHEMTHGFDDQGRQYDKDGNMSDWWTAEDAEKFQERAQVMINFFDSIEVAPGVHGNGRLTLGENIADHGGLKIAYQAYKKATASKTLPVINGFTPDQRFFLAYAGVWAGHIRPEEILRRVKTDPHSLAKWRVNGALPQIQAWYDAFNITEKDPLYVAPEKRVNIW